MKKKYNNPSTNLLQIFEARFDQMMQNSITELKDKVIDESGAGNFTPGGAPKKMI